MSLIAARRPWVMSPGYWAKPRASLARRSRLLTDYENWSAAGVDGVNLMYSTTPGTFVDFIEYVAPELQRRGLMQREYAPGTLREKLFGAGRHLPDRHVGRSYRYWDLQRTSRLTATNGKDAIA